MAKLKYDKNRIRQIENKMTKLYKKEIATKDLYDTGALYRSISVKLVIEGSKISFKVYSEDYLKYLDEPFSVTEDFLNSSGYKEVLSDIEDMVAEAVLESIGNRGVKKGRKN
jgi:hypothetical protein